MNGSNERFEIVYKGVILIVQPAIHEEHIFYQIKMPDKRLFITQIAKMKGGKLTWISMPKGDQKLAEELGELIECRLNAV